MSSSATVTAPAVHKAILVAVHLPEVADEEAVESFAELGRLAKTLGLEVAGELTQRRTSFDPGTYLGAGKVEELRQRVEGAAADTIIVNDEITPSQARNLEKAVGALVMDRTGLILEIFHRHASSRAAKAQVEIVRLKYLAPRLREKGQGKDRQRGGIGGKGAGESQVELDRRKIRDRIAELTCELESLDEERASKRHRRRDLARAALVGYTNAGKSTLMRALTGSEVYVADKLFATLDTTVRALCPETRPRILLSDTVGFLKKLPHGLVASFKSTLDEALSASLLVHVVDASDVGFERQLEVTHEVLEEIGAGEVPRLLVFNKIDRAGDATAESDARKRLEAKWPEALVLSAKRADDIAGLRAKLVTLFVDALVEGEISVPWHRQHVRADVFASSIVLEERAEAEGAVFRVKAHPETLARLSKK